MARECNSKNSCPACSGKHHLALCQNETEDENPPGGGAENTEDGDDGTTNMVSDGAQLLNEATSKGITSNAVSVTNHYVLLQTAKTKIFGSQSKSKTTARVIFDNCSQRSYIKESLRQKLNLQKVGEKMVSIKAFGAEKGEVKLVDIVVVRCASALIAAGATGWIMAERLYVRICAGKHSAGALMSNLELLE